MHLLWPWTKDRQRYTVWKIGAKPHDTKIFWLVFLQQNRLMYCTWRKSKKIGKIGNRNHKLLLTIFLKNVLPILIMTAFLHGKMYGRKCSHFFPGLFLKSCYSVIAFPIEKLQPATWLLRYTLTLPNKLFLKGRKTSTVENYASAVSQSVVFLAPKNICIDLHFYVIFQARLDCKSLFFSAPLMTITWSSFWNWRYQEKIRRASDAVFAFFLLEPKIESLKFKATEKQRWSVFSFSPMVFLKKKSS